MALYWHDHKIALDIIDDPLATHVDESIPDDWQVLRVTCDQITSLEGSRQIGDTLREMMGMEPIEKTPEWLAANERLHDELLSWLPIR